MEEGILVLRSHVVCVGATSTNFESSMRIRKIDKSKFIVFEIHAGRSFLRLEMYFSIEPDDKETIIMNDKNLERFSEIRIVGGAKKALEIKIVNLKGFNFGGRFEFLQKSHASCVTKIWNYYLHHLKKSRKMEEEGKKIPIEDILQGDPKLEVTTIYDPEEVQKKKKSIFERFSLFPTISGYKSRKKFFEVQVQDWNPSHFELWLHHIFHEDENGKITNMKEYLQSKEVPSNSIDNLYSVFMEYFIHYGNIPSFLRDLRSWERKQFGNVTSKKSRRFLENCDEMIIKTLKREIIIIRQNNELFDINRYLILKKLIDSSPTMKLEAIISQGLRRVYTDDDFQQLEILSHFLYGHETTETVRKIEEKFFEMEHNIFKNKITCEWDDDERHIQIRSDEWLEFLRKFMEENKVRLDHLSLRVKIAVEQNKIRKELENKKSKEKEETNKKVEFLEERLDSVELSLKYVNERIDNIDKKLEGFLLDESEEVGKLEANYTKFTEKQNELTVKKTSLMDEIQILKSEYKKKIEKLEMEVMNHVPTPKSLRMRSTQFLNSLERNDALDRYLKKEFETKFRVSALELANDSKIMVTVLRRSEGHEVLLYLKLGKFFVVWYGKDNLVKLIGTSVVGNYSDPITSSLLSQHTKDILGRVPSISFDLKYPDGKFIVSDPKVVLDCITELTEYIMRHNLDMQYIPLSGTSSSGEDQNRVNCSQFIQKKIVDFFPCIDKLMFDYFRSLETLQKKQNNSILSLRNIFYLPKFKPDEYTWFNEVLSQQQQNKSRKKKILKWSDISTRLKEETGTVRLLFKSIDDVDLFIEDLGNFYGFEKGSNDIEFKFSGLHSLLNGFRNGFLEMYKFKVDVIPLFLDALDRINQNEEDQDRKRGMEYFIERYVLPIRNEDLIRNFEQLNDILNGEISKIVDEVKNFDFSQKELKESDVIELIKRVLKFGSLDYDLHSESKTVSILMRFFSGDSDSTFTLCPFYCFTGAKISNKNVFGIKFFKNKSFMRETFYRRVYMGEFNAYHEYSGKGKLYDARLRDRIFSGEFLDGVKEGLQMKKAENFTKMMKKLKKKWNNWKREERMTSIFSAISAMRSLIWDLVILLCVFVECAGKRLYCVVLVISWNYHVSNAMVSTRILRWEIWKVFP